MTLHPKVAAALLATWITTIVAYSLHTWAHIDLPAEVAAALTGLIGFAAGWLTPSAVSTDAAAIATPPAVTPVTSPDPMQ